MSRLAAMGALLLVIVCFFAFASSAGASTIAVQFLNNGVLTSVERAVPAGTSPAEAAVRALVAGPTKDESAMGFTSSIPEGTTIVQLIINGDTAEVDLSDQIMMGFSEAALQNIFDQFRTTLGNFAFIKAIKLTCRGQLLSSYLPPAPVVGSPAVVSAITTSGVGLSGKKVCVGASHGKRWNGSYWAWQRSDPCGLGEAVLEDTNSVRLVQFLKQYLEQDGATFSSPRQLDESDCCNSDTGLPWWKLCAQSWLHHIGAPGSVWASYSGNTGADSATDRSSDDIRARPLYADNQGADIYIAHHTNAGGGTGTETFHDTSMANPTWESASTTLATAIQNNVISAIRTTYDGESGWVSRGVKDSAGSFGEIRIPNRPAALIELAFHDKCDRDAPYLTDDFFRSVAEWGLYKGVCEYFGNTPTWDKYSNEYVSDTFPATMMAGQTRSVTVTMRNRGVCWFTSRGFRLGAVGESDPFTSFSRVDISGEVKPGNTYTFTFNITAPTTPGAYTSDWRMVRDGYAWFGPTVTKTINVVANDDVQPPTVPANLHSTSVQANSISLAWSASTDNYFVAGYRVYRNGTQIATTTDPSYTDSSLTAGTTYSYQVDAYDGTSNSSAKCAAVYVATTSVVFQDGIGSLNNWVLDPATSGNVAPTYSTAQNHGTAPGAGSIYIPGDAPHFVYHDLSSSLTEGGYKTGILSAWVYDVSGAASGLRTALRSYLYDSGGSTKAIYWIGVTNGNPPNVPTHYIGAVFNGSWTYFDLGARSTGWHKLAIEILPYTGSNDLKFYVDGTAVLTTSQPSTAQNAFIRRIYVGYNYKPTQETYYDDIMFDSSAPAPPSGLSGAAQSATSIRWSFTDNANNEAGFRLYNGSTKVMDVAQQNLSYIDETGLQPNSSYSRTVKAYAGSLESSGATAVMRTLSVPPSAQNVTCDKPTGVAQTGDAFTFTAVGGFGVGKVDHYLVAWDQSPTHVWTGGEAMWSSGTCVQVASGTGGWYLHVKGYNLGYVENGTLDLGPFYYDGAAPVVSSVDDGTYTASTTELHATWTCSEAGTGGVTYEYAIGTLDDTDSVRSWTSAGSATEVTATGLNLNEGTTYRFSVRATDAAGNVSAAAESDGVKVAPLVAKISDAKLLNAGLPCRLLGKQVVGTFGGRAYIEESNRTSAIAVVTSATVACGDLIDVAGEMSAASQERAISAGYVKVVGSADGIRPLFMIIGKAGGSAFGPSVGAIGGQGLNNVGLLICVSGISSGRNETTGEFTVTDGSGSMRVVAPGMIIPADGGIVRVAGVVRLDETLHVFLSPTTQADIHPY